MIVLNVIETSEGIGGVLRGIAKITEGSRKIIFIGTPGFCTPFAELAAYALRKSSKVIGFVVNDRVEDARALIPTEFGVQLG